MQGFSVDVLRTLKPNSKFGKHQNMFSEFVFCCFEILLLVRCCFKAQFCESAAFPCVAMALAGPAILNGIDKPWKSVRH